MSAVLSIALVFMQLYPAAGPCRLSASSEPTRELQVSASGFTLRIPAAWTEAVEEHHGIVRIQDDRDRGCRLVLTWHEGADAATRIRRVHERLYLGRNHLPVTCTEDRVGARLQRDRAVFGEYDRDGRRRVYSMFWSTGAEGFAALLTCPRGGIGDWRVPLSVFSSIRRTAP